MVGDSRWGIMFDDGMLFPDSWATRKEAEVVLGEVRNHGYDCIVVEWKEVEFDRRANRRGVKKIEEVK